ncbi:hypothetical protein V1503_02795 [Bacillus sp. SCS-151]|uniref:hypothetical protein n=1 Tax=Nanhaiella sioensis TaxID=3115293 RepID=UPI00397DC744
MISKLKKRVKVIVISTVKKRAKEILVSLLIISVILNYVQYKQNNYIEDRLQASYLEYITDIYWVNFIFPDHSTLEVTDLEDFDYSQLLQNLSKLTLTKVPHATIETDWLIANTFGLVKDLYDKSIKGEAFTEEDLTLLTETSNLFKLYTEDKENIGLTSMSSKEILEELVIRNQRLIDAGYGQ